MPIQNSPNIHRPPHYYQSNCIYSVTAATLYKRHFFDTYIKKRLFIEILFKLADEMRISIYAWFVWNNHYHTEIAFGEQPDVGIEPLNTTIYNGVTPQASPMAGRVSTSQKSNIADSLTAVTPKKKIARFINRLHSVTALHLNRMDRTPRRRVWYQYWDKSLETEKGFWTCFNYIHQNAIKHGCVPALDRLSDYPFSSFTQWLKNRGEDWLADCFSRYPIVDFTISKDDF